ncbi:MAG: phosphatidate cytidylyltransferase [Brachymonas sp.]
MLGQRIITAVVLLAILLPALFAQQPAWFMAVTLVLITLACWEWGRLNGYHGKLAWLTALEGLGFCAVMWKLGWPSMKLPLLWLFAGTAWIALGIWLIARGVGAWQRIPAWWRVSVGLLLLSLAWLAVVQARLMGINFLLSMLVTVWVADIGAYFAGRRFGKKKLAHAISPGKSWEGVYGGMAAVLVLAVVWAQWTPSFADSLSLYQKLLRGQGWLLVILGAMLMVAMSVVGDLVESLVKRSSGVKDSSGLLPGHGGVLDRVDALLPTLPLGMMLYSLA